MTTAPEHVRLAFYDQFDLWANTYVDEKKTTALLTKDNHALKALDRVPTVPLRAELEEITSALLAQCRENRQRDLERRAAENTLLTDMIITVRENRTIGNRCGAREVLNDSSWVREQVSFLTPYDRMMDMITAAAERERARIEAGEHQEVCLDAKEKATLREHLVKKIAQLESSLVELKSRIPLRWVPLSHAPHVKHDCLKELMVEYVAAAHQCEFPIEPRHMRKVHPAYGHIQSRESEGYHPSLEIRDPKCLAAYEKLAAFCSISNERVMT